MIDENVISPGVPLFAVASDGRHTEHQADTKGVPLLPLRNPMLSTDIKNTIAFEIGFAVPEVEAVFACLEQANNVLHVWSVVPTRDRDVYRRIYSTERQLIAKFDYMGFDFNVIASCGRDPKTLINNPGVELSFAR